MSTVSDVVDTRTVDPGVAEPVAVGPADDVVREFFRIARDEASRTAIVHNGVEISYQELARRVRLTAHRYGAVLGDSDGATGFISVLVSHRPAVVEHALGVLQAGACYCPIDAALPVERQRSLSAAVGGRHVFSLEPMRREDNSFRVGFIGDGPIAGELANTEPQVERGVPAYVFCTSGSTGAPKPVVVSRGALGVTVRELRRLFELTPDDRVLQFASLAWDTCLEEIMPAITSGATLVFDDAAHSGSFPAFVRMLAEQRVTVVDLPTAFWHELVLYLHEEQTGLPPAVRLVIIGGERVDPTRLRQWRDLELGDIRLLNTYGCTETTMITHAVQLAGPGTAAAVHAPDAEAPIGRRLPHVVDRLGDDGELLISGPALADGYLGMTDATDKGFPIEGHGSGSARWFRTGDIVSRGPDGLLYSRGRADEQVKVLGVRVHPAEVEMHLNTHPAVAAAVVVGERRLDRVSLTAYVVVVQEVTATELKRYLRDRLPGQFVPSKVRFVPALSYTASGKVDRARTHRAATEKKATEDVL